MQKISVSVVAYANSLPFLYGLQNSKISESIDLQIDIPSVCADKFLTNSVDISLVPVAEILKVQSYKIISDLCIGANDHVKTVILASDCPLHELETIYLDYQSRTSVKLVKVLAKHFWKISPHWVNAQKGFESDTIKGKTGAVVIGDRTFSLNAKYKYDLSHEWKNFKGLPFVFAAWLTQKDLHASFVEEFNASLHFGVNNIEKAVGSLNRTPLPNEEICRYLHCNINYVFDEEKKSSLKQFLDYAREFTNKEMFLP
jgi:chorismate dehydratase